MHYSVLFTDCRLQHLVCVLWLSTIQCTHCVAKRCTAILQDLSVELQHRFCGTISSQFPLSLFRLGVVVRIISLNR